MVSPIYIPVQIKAIKKPNSLILVPHQQNIHDMSNGLLKSADGSLRIVHQCKGSTKEVQTEEKVDEWSLVSLMQHSGSDDSQKQDPLSSECSHQKMVSICNMLEATSDKCDKHQSHKTN